MSGPGLPAAQASGGRQLPAGFTASSRSRTVSRAGAAPGLSQARSTQRVATVHAKSSTPTASRSVTVSPVRHGAEPQAAAPQWPLAATTAPAATAPAPRATLPHGFSDAARSVTVAPARGHAPPQVRRHEAASPESRVPAEQLPQARAKAAAARSTSVQQQRAPDQSALPPARPHTRVTQSVPLRDVNHTPPAAAWRAPAELPTLGRLRSPPPPYGTPPASAPTRYAARAAFEQPPCCGPEMAPRPAVVLMRVDAGNVDRAAAPPLRLADFVAPAWASAVARGCRRLWRGTVAAVRAAVARVRLLVRRLLRPLLG